MIVIGFHGIFTKRGLHQIVRLFMCKDKQRLQLQRLVYGDFILSRDSIKKQNSCYQAENSSVDYL